MNAVHLILLAVSSAVLILILILRLMRRDLEQAREELEEMKLEVIRKNTELEAIRDVQKTIRKGREIQAPKRSEAPSAGDSTSRLDRLNRVQDGRRD